MPEADIASEIKRRARPEHCCILEGLLEDSRFLRFESEVYSQARRIIVEPKLDIVQLRDGSNERQAKPATRRRSAALKTIEPPEYIFSVFRWYAGSAVGYAGNELRAAPFETEPDPCSFRCVADGVVEKICKHFCEEVAVAPSEQPWFDLQPHDLSRLARPKLCESRSPTTRGDNLGVIRAFRTSN